VRPLCHHPNKSLTGYTSSDVCTKRQREPVEEDSPETTVVKAQKLTEHDGCPRAKDYDNVTQEFVNAAIGDYRA